MRSKSSKCCSFFRSFASLSLDFIISFYLFTFFCIYFVEIHLQGRWGLNREKVLSQILAYDPELFKVTAAQV